MKKISIICTFFVVCISSSANAQAWRDCIRNSIGPGGCESIGPGGGMSIGPGGGQSIGEAVSQLDLVVVNRLVQEEGNP